MYHNYHFTALILAAGSAQRFGDAIPKQFHRLSGKKVYLHTIETFLQEDTLDTIIIVGHSDYLSNIHHDLAPYEDPRITIIPGGKSRQESSYLGLNACPPHTDYVVIHDGARPLLRPETLRANIAAVINANAVDTCIPSTDTIVCVDDARTIDTIPNRYYYYRGQTPQSFHYPLIMSAHQHALLHSLTNISDDCRLVRELGKPVHVVLGEEDNIKITTELDLSLAEHLLRLRTTPLTSSTASLEGKRYLIVGGTGGIGKAICDLLTKEKATPIPLSRFSIPHSLDITDRNAVQQLFQTIGPVDGIVNSAGCLFKDTIQQTPDNAIDEMIDVNLRGLITCCKYALITPGGHIVTIASSSFSRGRPETAVYSATKAAVVNFTQALAAEHSTLRINTIVPARTNTPMRSHAFPNENPSTLLPPHTVAYAVVSLLKTSHLTAHTIDVRPS